MTPAAERNRRIVFEKGIAARGPLGGKGVASWTEFAIAWARVLFGSGQERRQAGAEGASQTATFRVLSNVETREVNERDRIQFDGRAWDITSVAPIGVNEEIEFTAVVAKG